MKNNDFLSDRNEVVDYIRKQLVGPCEGESEVFYQDKPDSRYVMGVLYPQNLETDSSGVDSTVASDAEDIDDSPLSMVFQLMPASMGLSFFVQDCDQIDIKLEAGKYRKVTKQLVEEYSRDESKSSLIGDDAVGKKPKWIRESIASHSNPEVVRTSINYDRPTRISVLQDSAILHVVWRPMSGGSLVTVTLLNSNVQDRNTVDPSNCLYQVAFSCVLVSGRIDKYPSSERLSFDEEEEELSLQYKNKATYAVGHGCASNWSVCSSGSIVVKTEVLPTTEVKPVTTTIESLSNDALSLQVLSDTRFEKEELISLLSSFVDGYERWYVDLVKETVPLGYEKASKRILARIAVSIDRMRQGIRVIDNDSEVRRAFQMANQAMLMQMIHSRIEYGGGLLIRGEKQYSQPDYYSDDYSESWRPFQLAYQLLSLESTVNLNSEHRDTVDLLWFPTGGGKTEAYLALAAFELIYRRIRYGEDGAGTAVIKRYTLRLLTTQQFQRAATLICALEIMRRENPSLLGLSPFRLGLWVGEASSPNRFTYESEHAKGAYELYNDMLEENRPENPFQLQKCPWCGTEIVPKFRTGDSSDYGVEATQTTFKFYCPSDSCDLHDSIPVTVVDEDIFETPPSFVIGTVDKFARLAWDHRASGMFGIGNLSHMPPSLIIQDELHLISGPLGTIAGLYEAAIDTLIASKGFKPKVIAATATIRRADDQVKGLYGRNVRIFPSPGLDSDDSYFAKVDKETMGRLYIGVMGQGHTPMTTLVHTSAVLSQAVVETEITDRSKDSWWTQVIYHNSKRELGKTMTLSRDDFPERIKVITSDSAKMRDMDNVDELSANIRGIEIPEVLSRLDIPSSDPQSVDLLPCTNMISVGVDVSRLGCMLILGQPKTTAEYIQASSRVGRDSSRPSGIVVTLYSSSKPRDRSHYENFVAYHRSLYRYVEPTSVTPYAPPARNRALHAALVILARHGCGYGANDQAAIFNPEESANSDVINHFIDRAIQSDPKEGEEIKRQVFLILEDWKTKIDEARRSHKPLRYNGKNGNQFTSLLKNFSDTNEDGWPTLNSMRNVDVECLITIAGESDGG